jgi:hypothetical protein
MALAMAEMLGMLSFLRGKWGALLKQFSLPLVSLHLPELYPEMNNGVSG